MFVPYQSARRVPDMTGLLDSNSTKMHCVGCVRAATAYFWKTPPTRKSAQAVSVCQPTTRTCPTGHVLCFCAFVAALVRFFFKAILHY